MTLLELHHRYIFHDSVLNQLEYHDHELKLYCQFCEFMQAEYNEKDDANSDIIIVFHDAAYHTNGNWKIRDAVFLNQKIEDNAIVFFMESSPDEVGELMINARAAEVFKLRTYNL